MPTDYDTIAERYRKAKQQPWRSAVEAFTLLDLAGDVSGLEVVDLACGEGHYTRPLKQKGAARTVGVDLSAGMIGLAKEREEAEPLGIEYLVGDALALPSIGPFDLAFAAYLLNYARSREELEAMCRGVANCLRPGGRFVAANTSPFVDYARTPELEKYGVSVRAEGPLREGTPITWTFLLDDGPLHVENFYLDAKAHDEALRAAGFREVAWHRPRLSPARGEVNGWGAFLDIAPVVFLECRK
ncbi:MAG: methyltransferase domain-containing protein [Isosphaeraceae bacterium]